MGEHSVASSIMESVQLNKENAFTMLKVLAVGGLDHRNK